MRGSLANVISSGAAAVGIFAISALMARVILMTAPQFYSVFLTLEFPFYYFMLVVPLIGLLPILAVPSAFLGMFGRSGKDVLVCWMATVCFLFVFIVAIHLSDSLWLYSFSPLNQNRFGHFDVLTLSQHTLMTLLHLCMLSPASVEFTWSFANTLVLEPNRFSTVPMPSLYPIQLLVFVISLTVILQLNRNWKYSYLPLFVMGPVLFELMVFLLIRSAGLEKSLPTTVDVFRIGGTMIYYSYYGLLLGCVNHLIILIGMAIVTFSGAGSSSSPVN
jgi:hypothetical protein